MEKRLFPLLLALCMALAARAWAVEPDSASTGSAAEAASEIASGSCGDQGDNLTWTLDSNGVLIISGT